MLRIVGHLIATAFRVFGRIVFTALFGRRAGRGGGAADHRCGHTSLAVAAQPVDPRPPGRGAVLAAYAGGVTVLMIEAVRGLTEAAKTIEHEAIAPLKAVEQELGGDRR